MTEMPQASSVRFPPPRPFWRLIPFSYQPPHCFQVFLGDIPLSYGVFAPPPLERPDINFAVACRLAGLPQHLRHSSAHRAWWGAHVHSQYFSLSVFLSSQGRESERERRPVAKLEAQLIVAYQASGVNDDCCLLAQKNIAALDRAKDPRKHLTIQGTAALSILALEPREKILR